MYHPKRFWTQRELDTLVDLASQNVSTTNIARKLGRTPLAVRIKASRLNLPLTEFDDRRTVSIGGRPPRVRSPRVTANFDLSGLSRQERVLLFNRLIETTPELIDVAKELIAQAEQNRPRAFDASGAATARNQKRVAEWRENRLKLGWFKKPGRDQPSSPKKGARQLRRGDPSGREAPKDGKPGGGESTDR